MKILVVASHPDIQNSVVNRYWLEILKKEENIRIRFLDELYDKKEIDVEIEKKYLEECDRVIFQYPFYWYNMPGLLRNYFDKVLEYGWAYGPGGNALKEKELLVAVSVGAAEHTYQGGGFNNYTMTELLRPVQATAVAVKMRYLPAFCLFDIPKLTEKQIQDSGDRYLSHIKKIYKVQEEIE